MCYGEYTFIDLGSGKGRVLLLASELPFKEIIGVEVSPYLNECARKNILLYNSDTQRCRSIKSICQDAMEFTVPDGNVVFYLYNPFNKEVMHSVISKIEASAIKHPREMYIVYVNPAHSSIIENSRVFSAIKRTGYFAVYRNKCYCCQPEGEHI